MTELDPYWQKFGVAEEVLQARGLKPYPEASVLEIAEVGADGREHRLVPSAAGAWRGMKLAADSDGVSLVIVSAFRSITRQAEIVRSKLLAGQSIDEILEVSAFPGYSEHHTGRALDLSMPGLRALQVEFEDCAAFEWLGDHAEGFGFRMSYPPGNPYGYQYEPWHWCFEQG